MAKKASRKKTELILLSAAAYREGILRKARIGVETQHYGFVEGSVKDMTHTRPSSIADAKLDLFLSKNALSGKVAAAKFSMPLVSVSSIVVYKDEIRGRPKDVSQHQQWVREYGISKDPAIVIASIALWHKGRRVSGTEEAVVHFIGFDAGYITRELTKEIFFDRAGGFNAGHPAWNQRIRKIEGNKDCALGMPITLLKSLLEKVSS